MVSMAFGCSCMRNESIGRDSHGQRLHVCVFFLQNALQLCYTYTIDSCCCKHTVSCLFAAVQHPKGLLTWRLFHFFNQTLFGSFLTLTCGPATIANHEKSCSNNSISIRIEAAVFLS